MRDLRTFAEEILERIDEEEHAFDWAKSGHVHTKVLNDAIEAQAPRTYENMMRIRDLALEIARQVGMKYDKNSPINIVTEAAYFVNYPERTERLKRICDAQKAEEQEPTP